MFHLILLHQFLFSGARVFLFQAVQNWSDRRKERTKKKTANKRKWHLSLKSGNI